MKRPSKVDLFSQKLLRFIAKERRAWDKIRVDYPNEGAERALQVLRDVADEVRALRGGR